LQEKLSWDMKHPKSLYVDFNATITSANISRMKNDVVAMRITANYAQVVFLLSSPGGVVEAALEGNTFIQNIDVPTVAHNTGSVGSAMNVVFSAADSKYASANSNFLLHPVIHQYEVDDEMFFPSEQIASVCHNSTTRIIYAITNGTEIPRDLVAMMMSQETILTALEAFEIGLVNGVVDSPVPSLYDDQVVIENNRSFIMRGGQVYYK